MPIGSFEEQVLLALVGLSGCAYGVPLIEAFEKSGKRVTVGALYTTLDRLEEKGLVYSWLGESTPERGGRRKRYFQIHATGHTALQEAEQARERLRQRGG